MLHWVGIVPPKTKEHFVEQLYKYIRTVPDFPKPGINFLDITPLLQNARAFETALLLMSSPWAGKINAVAGLDARGFIFGAAIARQLQVGFIPIRKKGKLPWKCLQQEYALEYGTDTVEVHTDACVRGDRVLIVDDLLATGGTAAAACALVERLGAKVYGCSFLIELADLGGRQKLGDRRIQAVCTYGEQKTRLSA
jgi:adenine phosphoribosyltransferase